MTRIKSLRHDQGETQESVAALIGITRGAYANIENGKREPDIKTIITLANHFGVTIDYLLGHDEAEKTPAPTEGDGLDDLDKKLLALIHDWSPKQKEYLLAHLQSLSGQGQ